MIIEKFGNLVEDTEFIPHGRWLIHPLGDDTVISFSMGQISADFEVLPVWSETGRTLCEPCITDTIEGPILDITENIKITVDPLSICGSREKGPGYLKISNMGWFIGIQTKRNIQYFKLFDGEKSYSPAVFSMWWLDLFDSHQALVCRFPSPENATESNGPFWNIQNFSKDPFNTAV